jgi:hypothetical protein
MAYDSGVAKDVVKMPMIKRGYKYDSQIGFLVPRSSCDKLNRFIIYKNTDLNIYIHILHRYELNNQSLAL